MGNERTVSVAAIILASGMSQRMGTTKQLLFYEGMPLLEYTIRKILPLPFSKIVAIIGHRHEEIMNAIRIEDNRFEWHFNSRFHLGQSESLKCAVNSVQNMDGMMVFLADQPLIRQETIHRVFDEGLRHLSSNREGFVVQPSFSGRPGHPVLFSRKLFPAFDELQGDEGGKRVILQAMAHEMIPVEDSGILFDVDTREDYQELLRKMIDS